MNLNSSRRGFLGALAAVIAAPRKLFAAKPVAAEAGAVPSGFGQTGNPYQELGVTTVINAEGTMTTLGGSLIRPEVEAIMAIRQKISEFSALPFSQRRINMRARASSSRTHSPLRTAVWDALPQTAVLFYPNCQNFPHNPPYHLRFENQGPIGPFARMRRCRRGPAQDGSCRILLHATGAFSEIGPTAASINIIVVPARSSFDTAAAN